MKISDNNAESWTGFHFMKPCPRLNRLKYFGLSSFWISLILISAGIEGLLPDPYGITLFIVTVIIASINSVFLQIGRFHDCNLRGWLVLANMASGGLIAFIQLFIPGTKGSNRFGLEPKSAHIFYKLLGLSVPVVFALFSFSINYWDLKPNTTFTDTTRSLPANLSLQLPESDMELTDENQQA